MLTVFEGHCIGRMSNVSVTFEAAAEEARRETMRRLVPELGEFVLTDWSGADLTNPWPGSFNWSVINLTYRAPDRLELAIWVDNRLIGLGICESDGDAIVIHVIQGDPDSACPLVGRRALVMIDAATNYAQIRGKHLLRLHPVAELVNFYVTVFGFSPPEPATGSPYYWRRV